MLRQAHRRWWLLQHLLLAVLGFCATGVLLEIANVSGGREASILSDVHRLLVQFSSIPNEYSLLYLLSAGSANSTLLRRLQDEGDVNYAKPSFQSNRSRVLIIVPYRNRSEQLAIFVPELNRFLSKQDLSYELVVVEHSGTAKFNKGSLVNIGFLEAEDMHHNKVQGKDTAYFDCVVVHDIDLIPTVYANSYDCLQTPDIGAWMLSTAIEKYNWSLPSVGAVGGVGITTRTVFMKANGWSNRYFGWGGEDNDFFTRLHAINNPMHKRSKELGRYRSLQDGHYRAPGEAEDRQELLRLVSVFREHEGLTSVQYRRLRREKKNGYEHIRVELWQHEDSQLVLGRAYRNLPELSRNWKSLT